MKNINDMISNKVAELIKQQNKTVKDVASLINVSETGFHKMIKSGTWKVDTLVDLAKALGTNISVFFSDITISSEAIERSSYTYEILKTTLQYDAVLIDMVYSCLKNKEKLRSSEITYMEMLITKFGNFQVEELHRLVSLGLISSNTIDKIQELKQARTKYPELF